MTRVAVHVKLEAFEGPFELLFHLIEKNQIDLYDIPIAALTDQYLEAVAHLPRDMETISEFLLMAATLLEIKSKMLLPKPPAVEEEEADPREELIDKLIEYKRFRQAAEALRSNEKQGGRVWFRDPEQKLTQLFQERDDFDVGELLEGVRLDALYKLFEDVLLRRELRTDKIRAGFNAIAKDLYTIEDKISYIQDLLSLYSRVSFFEIFYACPNKPEKVVMFLALLELIKMKRIKIVQTDIFDSITIERENADGEVTAQVHESE